MLEALLGREIQLALIEGPEQRKDLHLEPFMEDHMVLVVPATHEWANHDTKVENLKSEPLLMREFGSGSRRVVEQALSKAGVKTKVLTISMELDSTEGLLSAVQAGLGITFVSRWAVRNQLFLGTLKIARVSGLTLSKRFSMAYPYSSRINREGSTARALRAGMSVATNPRRAMVAIAPPTTRGSCGSASYTIRPSSRLAERPATSPTIEPDINRPNGRPRAEPRICSR
jgi:DNA-binding transcriptional LysR family regulator